MKQSILCIPRVIEQELFVAALRFFAIKGIKISIILLGL